MKTVTTFDRFKDANPNIMGETNEETRLLKEWLEKSWAHKERTDSEGRTYFIVAGVGPSRRFPHKIYKEAARMLENHFEEKE